MIIIVDGREVKAITPLAGIKKIIVSFK